MVWFVRVSLAVFLAYQLQTEQVGGGAESDAPPSLALSANMALVAIAFASSNIRVSAIDPHHTCEVKVSQRESDERSSGLTGLEAAG